MKVLEREKNYLRNNVRLRKKENVVPSQNQFAGSLPVGYGPNKLLIVQSHKLLADMFHWKKRS